MADEPTRQAKRGGSTNKAGETGEAPTWTGVLGITPFGAGMGTFK